MNDLKEENNYVLRNTDNYLPELTISHAERE